VKTEKNSGTIAFRFRQVLLYLFWASASLYGFVRNGAEEMSQEWSPITHIHLIFVDSCIVDYSVEIPIRCSFVIEFIIPKFIEGSTCFGRHTAHHQEL